MSEATSPGRFVFDLPHTEAALALAGGASSQTLRQLEALTGTTLVLRGLQLEISGRPSQLERTAALAPGGDRLHQPLDQPHDGQGRGGQAEAVEFHSQRRRHALQSRRPRQEHSAQAPAE